MKATAKDLRFRSKELLRAVERGSEVTITYRGKPRARLVPVSKPTRRRFEQSPAFGLWKGHRAVRDVQKYVDKVRRSRY